MRVISLWLAFMAAWVLVGLLDFEAVRKGILSPMEASVWETGFLVFGSLLCAHLSDRRPRG